MHVWVQRLRAAESKRIRMEARGKRLVYPSLSSVQRRPERSAAHGEPALGIRRGWRQAVEMKQVFRRGELSLVHPLRNVSGHVENAIRAFIGRVAYWPWSRVTDIE